MTSIRDDVPQHFTPGPELAEELSPNEIAELLSFRVCLDAAYRGKLEAAQRHGEALREGAHRFFLAKPSGNPVGPWVGELRRAWDAAEACEGALRRCVEELRRKEEAAEPQPTDWNHAEVERHRRWQYFASSVSSLRADATGLLNKFGQTLAYVEVLISRSRHPTPEVK